MRQTTVVLAGWNSAGVPLARVVGRARRRPPGSSVIKGKMSLFKIV
ncbi:hypothetical protein ACQEVB_35600 [Pseudonocardia sp. CA-107938]